MRTTLNLPEDLLNEAMKAAHVKTKTKVIITALEELIRKSKISDWSFRDKRQRKLRTRVSRCFSGRIVVRPH